MTARTSLSGADFNTVTPVAEPFQRGDMGFGPGGVLVPIVQHQHGAPVGMTLQHGGQGGADQVHALFRHGAAGEGDQRFATVDRRAPQVDIDGVGNGEGLGFLLRIILKEFSTPRVADEDQAVDLAEAAFIAPTVKQASRRLQRIVPIEHARGARKASGDMKRLTQLLVEFDDVRIEVVQGLLKRRKPLLISGQAIGWKISVILGAFAAEDAQFRILLAMSQSADDGLHRVGLG